MDVALLQLFGAIASLVPGLLAQMTGTHSDAQAIERARDAYRAIAARPAGDAIDAHARGEGRDAGR